MSATAKDQALLREVAEQLEKWAREAHVGGWSTQQVEPMQNLALRIWEHLGRGGAAR